MFSGFRFRGQDYHVSDFTGFMHGVPDLVLISDFVVKVITYHISPGLGLVHTCLTFFFQDFLVCQRIRLSLLLSLHLRWKVATLV